METERLLTEIRLGIALLIITLSVWGVFVSIALVSIYEEMKKMNERKP